MKKTAAARAAARGRGPDVAGEAARGSVEDSLRASEERYRILVESVQDVIFSLFPDGRIASLNPAFERLLGWPREDWIGRHFAPLIHPDDTATAIDVFARVLRGETPLRYELRVRDCSGGFRVGEFHAAAQRDDDGRVVLVMGVARDITERKRSDLATRALLDVASDISGTLDRAELLARVQRRTAEVLPCDAVLTFFEDPHTNVSRLLSAHGLDDATGALLSSLAFARDERDFGGLLYDGQAVVIEDLHAQRWLSPEVATRAGFASAIVTPLRTRERFFGGLVAAYRQRVVPPPDSVALLQGIARQVSVAIAAVDLHAAQREEAHVEATVSHVSQELISSLDAPTLVERMGRLTREALGADISHTLLRDPESDAFVLRAGVGETALSWDALRALHVPVTEVKDTLAILARDGVFRIGSSTPKSPFVSGLMQAYGVAEGMVIALRRGGELVGTQTLGRRAPAKPFTGTDERIARGIGHAASLALENARLVGELEAANRLKSDFVATMSHELRTPLNVVLGYGDLLLDGAFGELGEQQRHVLERLHLSARGLFDLVHATLDLSRIEAGRADVHVDRVAVADLVDRLAAQALERYGRPQIRLRCEVAPRTLALQTDRGKLEVVLGNLLANALKFTDEGSVDLRASRSGSGVSFEVADTGIGIAPEHQEAIFESFRQVDPSPSRRHGGAGLGLYIARRLIELLRGRIEVESAPGAGSRFRVWVPSRLQASAGSAAADPG